MAQITPDSSLGAENSVVETNGNRDTINGGAIRDANLFHSFQEFNVEALREAYFTNPDGIANIFSRVTGNNISDIQGVLGVLGDANLYLINPNGILFGENARLDVNGSFFATTADSVLFDNGFGFNTANPDAPPLLTIDIPIGLRFRDNPGTIANESNLAVGQNLTFSGGNLELQGQLQAGGDLQLEATDTVQIRDSIDNPFIAAAAGELIVQGNQTVDIFALNHPNSGLFSGGDLVLRSADAVGGDAHYWSGGNFRIEHLDGNLGNLSSPNDPIIRSAGDVSFNNYLGSSLHILAGGSVNIGSAIITSPETGDNVTNFIQETVRLSNGTEISIDGSTQPTLDIRAGIKPTAIGSSEITGINPISDFFFDNNFLPENPILANTPTSANITIDSITMAAPDGVVLLTNQYQPNTSLSSGTIEVGAIQTNDTNVLGEFSGNSGSVFIDSKGNINITSSIVASSASGNAGDITLIAGDTVSVNNSFIASETFGAGSGGNISINARQLLIQNAPGISTSTGGSGDSGNIFIKATEKVVVEDSNIGSVVWQEASGQGGDISIETEQLSVLGDFGLIFAGTQGEGNSGNITLDVSQLSLRDGGEVSASTFGSGNAGDITVLASDFVEVVGISTDGELISKLASQVNSLATGAGGNLLIKTNRLFIADGGQIQAGTFGLGDGGRLTVIANESVEAIGTNGDGGPSGLFTSTFGFGSADAGDLTIDTGKLIVQDGAQIASSTFGLNEGNAGNLKITASESVEVIGTSVVGDEFSSSILSETGRLLSFFNPDARGEGGSLTIETKKLVVEDGAEISTQTFGLGDAKDLNITVEQLIINEAIVSASTSGEGDAGDLIISASDSVKLNNPGGLFAQVNSGTGAGGDLTLETKQLSINNGAAVSTLTANFSSSIPTEKDAGDLIIRASEFVEVNGEGSGISSGTLSVIDEPDRDGGNLTIETERLSVSDSGVIGSLTIGAGDAGDLLIRAFDSITVNKGTISAATQESTGNGGNVTLETEQLTIRDGSQVRADTSGEGQAGSLTINASEFVKLFDTRAEKTIANGLFTQTEGSGEGGELQINTSQLIVRDGSLIFAGTLANSQGAGGNLTVTASENVELSGGSGFSTKANGAGDAGNLKIDTGQLIVQDGSQVSASTDGEGQGGNLTVNASEFVELLAEGNLFTQTGGAGDAGELTIDTGQLIVQDGSRVSASTDGEGQGGNLTVNASEFVELLAEGGLFTQTFGAGDAGELTIDTGRLIVRDGSPVSTLTSGQGRGEI